MPKVCSLEGHFCISSQSSAAAGRHPNKTCGRSTPFSGSIAWTKEHAGIVELFCVTPYLTVVGCGLPLLWAGILHQAQGTAKLPASFQKGMVMTSITQDSRKQLVSGQALPMQMQPA
jgi:hypothetical protein